MGLASNGQKINGLAIAGQKFYPEQQKNPDIGKKVRIAYPDDWSAENHNNPFGIAIDSTGYIPINQEKIDTNRTYIILAVVNFSFYQYYLFSEGTDGPNQHQLYIAPTFACKIVG